MSYKLITYQRQDGPRAGIVIGGRAYDLAELSGNPSYASIRTVLENWDSASGLLAKLTPGSAIPGLPLDTIDLLAPVLYPGAIYCAGANYRDHVENMAKKFNLPPPPDPHELGILPWHFLKASWCAVGHRAKVPLTSDLLDWEAELTVVIGRTARNVSVADALSYIAAYTIGNDLSARDRVQQTALPEGSPFRYDWIGHKCFDGSCPIGPWLVPASDVKDPQNLVVRTYVNDVLKQDSNTSQMLFSITEQLSHLSSRITLHPGDIILTGTPAGVGGETGERLNRSDSVRVEIEGLGELVTDIV